MAATNATTATCNSGVDSSRSDFGYPNPAGLDLLCASLEHLYACYRKLVDNSAVATAPGRARASCAARTEIHSPPASGGRFSDPLDRRLSGKVLRAT
jgi:hypothetical protein